MGIYFSSFFLEHIYPWSPCRVAGSISLFGVLSLEEIAATCFFFHRRWGWKWASDRESWFWFQPPIWEWFIRMLYYCFNHIKQFWPEANRPMSSPFSGSDFSIEPPLCFAPFQWIWVRPTKNIYASILSFSPQQQLLWPSKVVQDFATIHSMFTMFDGSSSFVPFNSQWFGGYPPFSDAASSTIHWFSPNLHGPTTTIFDMMNSHIFVASSRWSPDLSQDVPFGGFRFLKWRYPQSSS